MNLVVGDDSMSVREFRDNSERSNFFLGMLVVTSFQFPCRGMLIGPSFAHVPMLTVA